MKKNNIKYRILFVYFVVFAAMMTALVKTISIQAEGVSDVFNGDGKIPMRTALRPTRTGDILDDKGTPLVTSVSKYDIYMDPTVPSKENFDKYLPDLCYGLSRLFPETSARSFEMKIRRARNQNRRYLLIHKRASNAERKLISKLPLFNLGRFKGGFIDTQEETLRKRPHGDMLARTLGYYRAAENNSKELKVGLEGAYRGYLAGEPGQEIEQKLLTGWKKTGKIVKDGVEGASIITSFDKEIQEVAQNELYNQLVKTNAITGSVIVMNVKTGFVKAMASLSRTGEGQYHETYNYAIGTKEVPGSTFKLASLMAALEDGKISLDDTVKASPIYNYFGVKLTEAQGHDYGKITIKQAFEKSSNVIGKVIYNAYKNEPNQFINRLKSFGLDRPIGIDIQGEPTPTINEPGKRTWWGGSLAWMGVGYEVQLTPLQILTFYNAVANNGTEVKPQFVKEIIRGNEVIEKFEPVVLKDKICSNKTLRLLQDCLEGVMKEGTGRHLNSSYFSAAGKTGTAAVLNDDNRYGKQGDSRYIASFVGYFPAEDPIYSCIVSITANGDNIYGASVSGSVFSAIANKVYASRLEYHDAVNLSQTESNTIPRVKSGNAKEIAEILKTLHIPYDMNANEDWVVAESSLSKISMHQRLIGKRLAPNVVGMSAKDAIYIMESAGLYVLPQGYGRVVSQSVPAGVDMSKYIGSTITLKLN